MIRTFLIGPRASKSLSKVDSESISTSDELIVALVDRVWDLIEMMMLDTRRLVSFCPVIHADDGRG